MDWWTASDVGCRARTEPVRAVVLHHTGGEGDAAQVYRTLRARRLSIHYVIDYDGTTTQHADHDTVTSHAGKANGWTIGIEVVNRARPLLLGETRAQRRHPRETEYDAVHGRLRRLLRFTDAQVEATRVLVARICCEYGLPIAAPTDASGELITSELPGAVLATYRGVLGHLHVSPAKWDPVPHLLRDVAG